jgi:hypothetical protein
MGNEPKKKEKKGIRTLDMSTWLPSGDQRASFDLKDFLFQGLLLKEKDFRDSLSTYDWKALEGKYVAVFCSTDAIIPVWAFMLVSAYLDNARAHAHFCKPEDLATKIISDYIDDINPEEFRGERLVVKGCGKESVSPEAYMLLTKKLAPVARAFSFGEACSTVPIWRQTA